MIGLQEHPQQLAMLSSPVSMKTDLQWPGKNGDSNYSLHECVHACVYVCVQSVASYKTHSDSIFVEIKGVIERQKRI